MRVRRLYRRAMRADSNIRKESQPTRNAEGIRSMRRTKNIAAKNPLNQMKMRSPIRTSVVAFILAFVGATNILAATPDYPWQRLAQTPIVTSASTITYDVANYWYVHNGTTCTATLPPVAGNDRVDFVVFNRGSGAVTLQRAGSDNLYTTSGTATSTTIAAGSWACVYCDGTYWCVRTGGSGGAPTTSGYIIQSPDASLPNAEVTGSLATGIVKNTFGSGVLSIAAAGSDYVAPSGALGTPSSGTLTSCTGLPISSGVSGLGTGVATWAATPTSANLAAAITNETGSGALVFATSPTLVTPVLGTPTSGDLSNCTGTTFQVSLSGCKQSPATSQSYFIGVPFQFGTSDSVGNAGFRRFYFPSACTIKKWQLFAANHGTAGSGESSTVKLKVNNTSSTTLSSSVLTNGNNNYSGTVSIAIAAGDYIEAEWDTPSSFSSSPTSVGMDLELECQK
jgi:hypothetical protein